MNGTALITALLVVALASVAAAAMLKQQHLDIRRAGNVFNADQAGLYTQSAEAWVIQVLLRDKRDTKTDSLADSWATLREPIDIEDGKIQVQVEDLQGRFNLNNLLDKAGKPSKDERERFQRLLGLLELDTDLVFPILDWIDSDINASFPGGAEDNEYLRLEPAHRTANAPFVSSSELLQVKGIGSADYERLKPYVTALPGQVEININTASAVILAASIQGMDLAEAEALVEARPEEGYADVSTFRSTQALNGRTVKGISVSSDYFSIKVDVSLDRHQSSVGAVVNRTAGTTSGGSGQLRVLRRSRAEL
ncbi:type II secretion system minor pseudopilin GspK [Sulfuriflexus mobilis]|uniref:type II secretion system minor pseudopilin GspK n=1 Tax=Sulfuriflexus mobilis TaxID=1811807 RepID=UPI0015593EA0|nr:type II secretion system minor pseudopilin GspK [Sulfuriflexus mobilis]